MRGRCSASGATTTASRALPRAPPASAWCSFPRTRPRRPRVRRSSKLPSLAEGLTVLGWREVPVDKDVVGRMAKDTSPSSSRCSPTAPRAMSSSASSSSRARRLRKPPRASTPRCPASPRTSTCAPCPVAPSCTRVCSAPPVVGEFYLDLKDEDFEAQFCIYHRRFSTNTVPKWPLAQPMRFLGHNGEINTLQGNLNWMASKEADMTHPVWTAAGRAPPHLQPRRVRLRQPRPRRRASREVWTSRCRDDDAPRARGVP